MRSFTLKAALAAILVSTSLAGAYAANRDHDHDRGLGSHRSHEFQPPDQADDSGYFDHMTMGPPPIPSVSPPVAATHMVATQVVRAPEYRPRLERVVNELGTANSRIRVDRDRGTLTRAEYRDLAARAHDIRRDAIRTADNHHGALPRARYIVLQDRIARLDSAIHHDAMS
ncbi:hypothetical protein [Kumtagia ephedrae]|uniref:Uncharacterized protein n=1 Tax=Kumtagia ephedrae TaxID=2116701 RepID=A0A2P7S5N6_9HYPH|nr:hypothetical protein [Mesorhizobium ephedrae]PSJ57731.1 hypothetical protein C7I84_17030 [Mesorhizobium ephedrae]